MTKRALKPADFFTPLGRKISTHVAHLDAAEYQLLVMLHEFDEKEEWGAYGIHSCAHWLNAFCGMNVGAARERVRVAHALPALPKISAEFRKGQVSYSKVRAMTRVATPENEEELLEVARHGTASQVEKLVRHYRLVHEEGYGIKTTAHGAFTFTLPDGRALQNNHHGRFRGNAIIVKRQNRDKGLTIDQHTAVPALDGQLDYDIAVEGLVMREWVGS